MPCGREALRRLRYPARQALAGARRRVRPLLRGARAAPRGVPGARRQGGGGPVGALGVEQVHLVLRGPGGLAGAAHVPQRPRRAHEGGLARRGRDMRPRGGLARGGRRAGPVRRAALDRRRRDRLQEGPQVHDRGGRPRPRKGRVDLRRARQAPAQRLPRPAHGGAARRHRGRHRRRALDRRRGRREAARRRARRGPPSTPSPGRPAPSTSWGAARGGRPGRGPRRDAAAGARARASRPLPTRPGR